MTAVPSFSAFFEAVHDYAPFPWQARLADRVAATGWPALLDLPTGSGKTSVLDIALYALAVAPQRAPRRVFLVVDRRIVVDQGALHARAILDRLRAGHAPQVAARLRSLFGAGEDEDPFAVAVLRGGMPGDEDWARRPDQPVVGVSTVDQVGSRLLFRGYGVSDRMAPVHAGLLGNDALFLLDEVHLAQPFAETLNAIATRWRRGALSARFACVRMSATPGADEPGSFKIDASDRAHPILTKRLGAKKRARLREVRVTGEDAARRETLADACAEEARSFLGAGASVVGVVVNRVDTARRAAQALRAGVRDADVVLLTGRMRPLDRDHVLEDLKVLERAGAARPRGERPCPRPLILVATQCIEAGADLDLDALVTECASLDALRQRFGRLDRRGDLGSSPAVVLMRSDDVAPDSPDPVYGDALPKTWAWLSRRGVEVGLGIDEISLPPVGELVGLLSPRTSAPVLLPAHLDSWTQTSPRPTPDPDVALWLHGPARSVPEVLVVWRADIEESDLVAAEGEGEEAVQRLESLVNLLAACRPSSIEALSLPIHAARAWLAASETLPDVGDVMSGSLEDREDRGDAGDGVPALRWAGDGSEIVRSGAIRPGDTLVVPSTRGGLGAFNWDPGAADSVTDLGDLAQFRARGRACLRTHPGALSLWRLDDAIVRLAPAVSADDDVDEQAVIEEWLGSLPREAAGRPSAWGPMLKALGPSPRIVELPNGRFLVVARGVAATTEEEDGSFMERKLSLLEHSRDVERWAGRFAVSVGLGDSLAADVRLAGWLHDVGKADPRFQRWLVGGNEVRQALLSEPIAKSSGSLVDRRSRESARRRAGYPVGCRHELLSLAMIDRSDEALASANDRDLVLHLVASHHGWCRPFAPPVDDAEDLGVSLVHGAATLRATTRHGLARLDSGVSDRFWRLVERYGWWGLAWLEAILRLADHRASEEAS